jgi:hypothetical protein
LELLYAGLRGCLAVRLKVCCADIQGGDSLRHPLGEELLLVLILLVDFEMARVMADIVANKANRLKGNPAKSLEV